MYFSSILHIFFPLAIVEQGVPLAGFMGKLKHHVPLAKAHEENHLGMYGLSSVKTGKC